MKRFFAILVAIVLSCSWAVAFADTESEQESEFQRVLLKKGTVIIKEFIEYGEVKGMTFQTACVIDGETGEKFYALRIECFYYNSKYDYGTTVGIMDADEIDGAITTLEYIKQYIAEMKDYSEVIYEATTGMQVGAYHAAEEDRVFIKVSSDKTVYLDVSDIDALIEGFRGVQATFVQ